MVVTADKGGSSRMLTKHATHYVELYEQDKKTAYKKYDALYFVNMLKDSEEKSALLKRLN